MNYIILDLEWNQCPDGKSFEQPLLPFEIIEIGAVKMNNDHEIIDRFHEMIRPQLYQTLHPSIRSLITIREQDLKNGRSFPEVSESFFEWCGADPLFCTWGSQDLTEFQRNLDWYHIKNPFPFPLHFYDIQKIFSIVFEDRKTRRSLEFAVEYLNISKKSRFHNAICDAQYTAEICRFIKTEDILDNSSVDCHRTPDSRRNEIYVRYKTYMKFISRPFNNKTDVMKDRTVTSTACYLCRKNARKKIRWFSSGTKNHICLAFCPEHGWLKGKIRIRQHQNGSYYVVKTLKLISDEEAYEIREKQEIIRLKRRLKRTFQSRSNNSDCGTEKNAPDTDSH